MTNWKMFNKNETTSSYTYRKEITNFTETKIPLTRVSKIIVVKVAFIISIILSSCASSSNQPSNKWTLASIYNPLKSSLHPVFKIHHNNTNNSVLFFKIRTNELFFRENPVNQTETCSFTLKYLLQEVSDESTAIVDSSTYIYELSKADVKDYYITQIPLKAREGNSYRLKVTVRDNNRKAFDISYHNIEKNTVNAEQYFNITTLNGTPLFKNVILNDGVFKINHPKPSSDSLYVSFYHNKVEAPKPLIAPSSDNYLYKQRDSLFVIHYSSNAAFSLPHEGMYYVQFDTNSNEGLTLLKLNNDFPKVKEPEGLLPPLSYITTDAEYKKLLRDGNPKLTADNFWIKAGGSPDRGRAMIRLYYNRVYFANYYFTNSKPGWKTDQGMVYVVYGPPHKMKKTAFGETWIYERKGDDNPITFEFKYAPNKYNLNNFILDRSQNNEWHWTEAVYAWTSGDIFLYD
ncbi:MAG TPA: hypothetical protein DDX98_01605 [Bacteroidales bacterium]|jgi:GWxTD domain-containing protein|nr:hypothetical protein [Bacteroidales bacterium]